MANSTPVNVSISISQCHNLRPLKGDSITTFLRVDHGHKFLGDSTRLECKTGEEAHFNHSLSLTGVQGDIESIGPLIQQPVVVSLHEALPKEKTLLMGQGCLDLLPLFHGSTSYFHSLTIHPSSTPSEEHPLISLDVEVSISVPLLPPGRSDRYSLLSLQLHSLYAPPDQWASSPTGTSYTFSLPVPANEGHQPILITNGAYRPKPAKDPSFDSHLRWSNLPSLPPAATVLSDRSVEPSVPEEEHGELRGRGDLEFRAEAETGRPRVVWNMERRLLLGEECMGELKRSLSQCGELPVELIRSSPPPPQKGGKGKVEEEPALSYHGVAFLSLSSLLYPGTTCVTGAYRVHAYSDTEVLSRTQCATSFILGTQSTRSSAASAKFKPVKRSGSSYQTSELAEEGEAAEYVRSYVHLSLDLSRPLVQRRTMEELGEFVSEYIPPRPSMPPRVGGAEKSERGYRAQVEQVATGLLSEMWDLFGEDLGGEGAEELEKRRIELQYQLNVTGRFYALKERLKHSVVSLVREKFQNRAGFRGEEEREAFLSELYVYLVDQMHQSLAHTLLTSQYQETPPSVQDPALLQLFAAEALANRDLTAAARYHQQRIAMRRSCADFWSDYGSFCLLTGDLPKCAECLKQAVACDQHHVTSLLLLGILSSLNCKYDLAESFLEAAASLDAQAVAPWVVLGLHYEACSSEGSNKDAMELTFRRAESLHTRDQPKIALIPPRASTSKVSLMSKDTRLSSREGLVNSKHIGSTTGTLADMAEKGEEVAEVEDEEKRLTGVSEGLTASQVSVRSIAKSEAIETSTPPGPVVSSAAKSVFMLTAEFLLERNALVFAGMALGHHLVGSESGPTSEYETLLARLELARGEHMEALRHSRNAIKLDIDNVQAWETLSHAQYLMLDISGARESYERTLASTGELLDPHLVYLRLASIYLEEGVYTKSKVMFLHGCRHSPSALTWLGVGISCYRVEELAEAEEALAEANILNNLEPEIWAYLCMVCLKTERHPEAEQTLRYALKCGLKDQGLLEEIAHIADELQLEWNF